MENQIENLLIDLLRENGNLIVNKKLIQKIELIPAILLSNYIEKHKYFKEHNPKNDGWFFLAHKKIMDEFNIKEYSITKSKMKLLDLQLITIERRGIPSKEWIKINYSNLYALLTVENYSTQVPTKTGVLVPTKTGVHNKTINIRKRRRSSCVRELSISDFDKFWELYPKKTDKGKVLTLWKQLCHQKDTPNWVEMKNAIELQMKTDRWKKTKFIPNPTTWLNQKRWLDDPKEMKNFEFDEKKPTTIGYKKSTLTYKTPEIL